MAVLGKAEITISDILDGNSITEITNFYKVSSKSTGEVAPPEGSGWSTTVPTLTPTNKYLWNYETIKGSNGSVISSTAPRVIGVYGDKGQTGNTGATGPAGNGISSIIEYYQISGSNSTAPTTWLTTVPTLTATGKYLWNYEKIIYTNGSTKETAKRVIGVYGDKGNTGATGPAGAPGKGVRYIVEKYAVSSSNSTAPTTWYDSVQTMTSTDRYLWNYETVIYTDGTTSTTAKQVIGVYGDKGNTGPAGANGKGVKSIANYYLVTSASSGVTTGTSGWSTTPGTTTTTNKYLWNYEKITYTDNTIVNTTPHIIGTHGATGPAGKGIKSTTITYQAGTSGTTAPTGTWSSSVPSVPQGQYLWSKTVITYTDNTTSTTYSVAYIPKNGQNGATGGTGATGTGVASIVQQYYLSTSKTSQTGGSWVTSMPTWSSGKYLWTRYQINYKNPTSTAYTSPICDSSWEAVNEIQVGGRNFVLKSDVDYKNANYLIATYKLKSADSLKEGDIVTIQIKGTLGADKQRFDVYSDYGSVRVVSIHKPNNKGVYTTTVAWTYTRPDGTTGTPKGDVYVYAYPSGGTSESSIEWIKIERGNKPTDWTPAPEDIQSDIEQVRADYKADLKIERDRITSSVSEISKLSSKTSTLEQTAKGLTLRLDQTDKNVSDAAKTATNYISADGQGIIIGDMSGSTLGSNVRIDTDSLDIRSGDTILAQYASNKISLGINNIESIVSLCGDKCVIGYDDNFFDNGMGCTYIDGGSGVNIKGSHEVLLGTGDQGIEVGVNKSFFRSSATGIVMTSMDHQTNVDSFYLSAGNGSLLNISRSLKIWSPVIFMEGAIINCTLASGIRIKNDMATSWVGAMKGDKVALSIDAPGATSSYNALARVKTTNGGYALGTYNQDSSFRIIYGNESRLNSGANGCDATWTFANNGFFNTYAMNAGFIELSRVQPYIDFHHNNSTADFTSRIAEYNSGILSINNVRFVHDSGNRGNIQNVGGLTFGGDSNSPRWEFLNRADELQVYQAGMGVIWKVQSNGSTWIRSLVMHKNVYPYVDNGVTCGTGGHRFSRFYSTNTSISTSDANEKTDINPIDERYENLFMKLRPVNFKWKNFSPEDNHERVHGGLIAQEVEKACLECGLDSTTFAALCRDDLDEPTPDGRTERYGMAYGELHGLEIHMIQKNTRMLEELITTFKELKIKNNLI